MTYTVIQSRPWTTATQELIAAAKKAGYDVVKDTEQEGAVYVYAPDYNIRFWITAEPETDTTVRHFNTLARELGIEPIEVKGVLQ